MEKKKPIINYKECMACGICVQACPFSCIDFVKINVNKDKKAYPELINNGRCTGCGICSKECPVEAIELR